MKRNIAVTFLVGTGIGLVGCQAPSLGRLAIWNRGNSAVAGSTAPDVGRQKFLGLSQQMGDQPRPMGQNQSGGTALGGQKPVDNDGFVMASWKKATAAVTGATVAKKVAAPEDDPLRLDRVPKKIGPEVYVGAARLLENSGSFAEAEAKYREALKAAPTDLNALVGLARLHDRQGEFQKAIETYHRAAQAHPTNGLIFNDLGLCHRRQNQLEKSLAAFRKAAELQPDNAKYRNNLAAALVDASRSDEAFHQLAAVNSAAVAHFNLAYLLQQKGLKADATRHLQEAVSLDPSLTPAREMLTQLGGAVAATATSTSTTAPPAPRATPLPKDESDSPYSAGAAETTVYTSPPQTDVASTALPIPSYHLGDDASAAAETAQRTNWGAAAKATPVGEGKSGNQPLPPVD